MVRSIGIRVPDWYWYFVLRGVGFAFSMGFVKEFDHAVGKNKTGSSFGNSFSP